MHTRAATCGKGIDNAHPFVNNIDNPEVAIIHNGMIYNDHDFKKKYSTCDSEVLVHLYDQHRVSTSLDKLNGFVDKLSGWFTVLALAKDASGRMVMDAFSDSGRLGSYFIEELDTRVYSTSADDIVRIAKGLGFTVKDYQKMDADTAFRIDVATGEQIEHVKLVSAPATYSNAFWENWGNHGHGNVTIMEGDLSDDEFIKRYWKGMGH